VLPYGKRLYNSKRRLDYHSKAANRNPSYYKRHYSGGSSGGSAVAVALQLCPLAVGFDGGGSIRIPASWSGVVGLAATFGRIDTAAIQHSMVKAGPIAGSVVDALIGLYAMSRRQEGVEVVEGGGLVVAGTAIELGRQKAQATYGRGRNSAYNFYDTLYGGERPSPSKIADCSPWRMYIM